MSTPDAVQIGVAAGTAVLALATWRMASATREMAEASKDELALLRDQHLEGRMPRLRVARRGDGSLSAMESASPGLYSLTFTIELTAGGAAELESAILDDQPGEIRGRVGPGQFSYVRFDYGLEDEVPSEPHLQVNFRAIANPDLHGVVHADLRRDAWLDEGGNHKLSWVEESGG
jgi:hypothetical protein